MLGLLVSEEARKHFIEMVGFKGGCPLWCNEEKTYVSEKQSEVKLALCRRLFSLRKGKKTFYI
jgi:hypothetical protein